MGLHSLGKENYARIPVVRKEGKAQLLPSTVLPCPHQAGGSVDANPAANFATAVAWGSPQRLDGKSIVNHRRRQDEIDTLSDKTLALSLEHYHLISFDSNARAIVTISSRDPRKAQSCERSSIWLSPVQPPIAGAWYSISLNIPQRLFTLHACVE
jgi:hypothetical protein